MLEACGGDVDTYERTVIACEETAHAHANACAHIHIPFPCNHALCFAAHTCDAINQSIIHHSRRHSFSFAFLIHSLNLPQNIKPSH